MLRRFVGDFKWQGVTAIVGALLVTIGAVLSIYASFVTLK